MDITDRKRAEEALASREEELRATLYSIGDAVISTDIEGRVVRMNPVAEQLTGWTKGEAAGQPLDEVFRTVSEETRRQVESPVAHVLREGMVVRLDHNTLLIAKDGKETPIDVSGAPILDPEGNVSGVVLVFQDQTDCKRAEEALRQERDRAKKYLELAGVMFVALDSKGEVTLINRKGCEILGCRQEEVLGKNWFDHFLPEKEKAKVKSVFRKLMSGKIKAAEYCENPAITKKGEQRFISWHNTVLRDGDGRVIGILSAGEDVTERKQTLDALKDSEERLRIMFEFAPDAYYISDMKGMFLDGNRAAEELSGYKKEELVGKNFLKLKLLRPAQLKKAARLLARNVRGQPTGPDEFIFNRKDGTQVPVEIMTFPVKIKGKRCVLGIARDITEQKHVQEAMRASQEKIQQIQKIEALGALAGGVAHDFNNVLTSIIGYTELAMDEAPAGTTMHSNLQEVFKAGQRGKGLVNQILTFSRMKKPEKSLLDIALILKEVIKLLRPSLPDTIDILGNIASDSWVMADPTQVHQVIMNLFSNAVDAMRSGGGILEVGLSDVEVSEEDAGLIPELKTGAYVKLSVRDTGCGMDEDTREKIFEPFFTTKKPGEGTGMGLSVLLGIVKAHGGGVTVYSEPGRGSTFNVYLPRSNDKGEKEEERAAALPSGRERILLVDDDEPIANLGRRVLESLGYQVVAMTDPVEALRVFQRRPRSFDLLITDVMMPEMPGDELVRKIQKIRPELPVVLCSGYTNRVSVEKAQAMGISAFLMKPVLKRTLAETVRQVLDKAKKEA